MSTFISSVRKEFAEERKALAKYIREDTILGKFSEVFIIEHVGSGTGDIIEKSRDRGLPALIWENEMGTVNECIF